MARRLTISEEAKEVFERNNLEFTLKCVKGEDAINSLDPSKTLLVYNKDLASWSGRVNNNFADNFNVRDVVDFGYRRAKEVMYAFKFNTAEDKQRALNIFFGDKQELLNRLNKLNENN